MSKFYILEEWELFDPNDMSEFAVEFDGNLREFVKEKIKQKSEEEKQKIEWVADHWPRNAASLKEELNITYCPDCKYCVKTKDGEYNPDDIVCSYWNSDGLEAKDYCSYGEKGEYKYEEYDKNIKKTNVDEGSICEKCGFKVPVKYLSCPFCKELDRIEGLEEKS